MLNFLKKHEKKFIAVVMVLLMITFVASSGYGRGATGTGSSVVIGTINGTRIYNAELAQARQEWQLANQYVKFPDQNTGQEMPLGAVIFRYLRVPEAFAAIADRPELFMLLRHEAREAPVQVNADDLQTIMVNYYKPPASADDPEGLESAVRAAVADLLLVQANCQRTASVVKVSAPQRQQKLAELVQQLTLNFVPLSAGDFLTAAPTPTPQQVQAQFDKYADTAPGEPTTENPFGFGYKLPERVKLQYLKIDHADAARAVEAEKTPYDWDVAARLYYLRHLSEFPATQPVATTQTVALPGPTTQPFEKARQSALENVRQPLIDKRLADVQSFVISALAAQANGGGASTQPTADTLGAIAQQATARFGVRVEPAAWDDRYYSAKELQVILPALSDPSADAYGGATPSFADTVMQQATSYLGRSDIGSPAATTALLTPAPPLSDAQHDVFIYRLTAARPTEAAPDITAAGALPIADVRTQAAFDAAKTAASKLVISAGHAPLAAAAMASGLHVQTSAPLSLQSDDLGPTLPLSRPGQAAFLLQAMQMLGQYDPLTTPHPLALLSVPQDRKVFVAQLNQVKSDAAPADLFQQADRLNQQLRLGNTALLLRQWCSYDAVAARVGYKPEPAKS